MSDHEKRLREECAALRAKLGDEVWADEDGERGLYLCANEMLLAFAKTQRAAALREAADQAAEISDNCYANMEGEDHAGFLKWEALYVEFGAFAERLRAMADQLEKEAT